MNDSMIDYMDKQEQELIKFECWYHSVIDDMAGLIRANGYEQVMFDVMQAVQRHRLDKRMSEIDTKEVK